MLRCDSFTCLTLLCIHTFRQTEGDTGYEDNEAYGEEYEDDTVIGMDPIFDVPIVNVTVIKGQTAVLPCSVDYLGKFKIAWLDHSSIPLSYEERRVVDDSRFSVVRPGMKEWNLQIREVKREDEGQYRCTINTNPVKSKLVMLHVKVPAHIEEAWSSHDVTVEEGATVVLTCNVTGVPAPQVSWSRPHSPAYRTVQLSPAVQQLNKQLTKQQLNNKQPDSCQLISETLSSDVPFIGPTLVLQNVSRYCDGWFECSASNGVPPSVSKNIRVTVEFAPKIELRNLRIGQQIGKETILECSITAYPHAVNYWEKDGRRITSSMKHRIEAYEESDHTITLSLKIHITDLSDFGEYQCVAANAFGRAEANMLLYDYTEDDRKAAAAAAESSMSHQFMATNQKPALDHVVPTPAPIKIQFKGLVTNSYNYGRMSMNRNEGHSMMRHADVTTIVTVAIVTVVRWFL